MRFVFAAAIVAGSLFTLNAESLAQMTQSNAPESQGRRICRYMDESGRLAARRRVCMTKAEWDRTAEEQRKSGQMMVDAVDSCSARAEGGSIAMGVQQGGGSTTFRSGGC